MYSMSPPITDKKVVAMCIASGKSQLTGNKMSSKGNTDFLWNQDKNRQFISCGTSATNAPNSEIILRSGVLLNDLCAYAQ